MRLFNELNIRIISYRRAIFTPNFGLFFFSSLTLVQIASQTFVFGRRCGSVVLRMNKELKFRVKDVNIRTLQGVK